MTPTARPALGTAPVVPGNLPVPGTGYSCRSLELEAWNATGLRRVMVMDAEN